MPEGDVRRDGGVRRTGEGFIDDGPSLSAPSCCLACGNKIWRRAEAALANLGFEVQPRLPKVVACTGTAACKLGICHAQGLAAEMTDRLRQLSSGFRPALTSIRISGCPNGCGGHSIASLGFEGRGRRIGDKLQPLYEVLVGGRPAEADARFGERTGTVPASNIPDLVVEIVANGFSTADQIRPLGLSDVQRR